MEFNNLNDLNKYLQTQIDDTLQNEVAESVKDTMIEAIDRTVYQKYDPLYYERRGDNGGLRDRDNISIINIKNGIIAENITLVNPGHGAFNPGQPLAPIIVSGQGYTYSGYGKPYERKRDFIKETTKLLEKNGNEAIENAIKDGLNKRGIDCD